MPTSEKLNQIHKKTLFKLAETRMRFLSFDHLISILTPADRIQAQNTTMHELFSRLVAGKKLNGADLVDQGLLGNREIFARGLEHVPSNGPLVVVANHDRSPFGTLYSTGKVAAINYAVEIARGRTNPDDATLNHDRNREATAIHWFQAGTAKNSIGRLVTSPINEQIAESFDHILVDRLGQNAYPNSIREALKVLKAHGVVGLFPEGDTSTTLQPIDPRADRLLKLLSTLQSRMNITVLPMSVLTGRSTVAIDIGIPLKLDSSHAGEQVMTAIAKNLPPRKRGAYRDSI